MAKPEQLSNLTYTRTWLSADDFPTIEPDETKVREDLQFHPDAVKDYINDKLLPSYNNILNEGLHCPGTLSFSGAVTAKYNGEVDVNISLPVGSGGGATATTTIECTLDSSGESVTFGALPTGYTNPFYLIEDSCNSGQTVQIKVASAKGTEIMTLAEITSSPKTAKFTGDAPVLDALDTEWHVLTVSESGGGAYAVVKGNPYSPIIGTVPPTTSTVGVVGQEYIDTSSKRTWRCTAISGGTYTWVLYDAGVSSKFDVTLSASGWTVNKTYTITSPYITATSAVEILPRENKGVTREQMDALAAAMIVGGTQSNGSIELVSLDILPEIDLPLTVIVRRDL